MQMMRIQKRILVAPLNWGLGHATRCIPIINGLLEHGFHVIIASDGAALSLLQKEYPQLQSFELPSYKIKYAKKGKNFKLKLIWDSPKVIKAMQREKKRVKELVKEYNIDTIISDNRLGVYYKKVPCIFITHQLNVLSGNTTWFSSKMHQKIIKKFECCWIPDVNQKPNLTGKLGHLKKNNLNTTYIGPISRFRKNSLQKKYDLLVLLSGPEPQRGLLQDKLLDELKGFVGNVLFIKGRIEENPTVETLVYENVKIIVHNFMTSKNLENALNSSEVILSRSGYTTVMDLAKLEKKAFFIPTPGQYEQEYLAKRLDKKGIVPYAKQEDFTLKELHRVKNYTGLVAFENSIDYTMLISALSNVNENSDPTSTSLST